MTFHALADDRKLILRHPTGIVLPIALAVTPHSDGELFRKSVNAGPAHAVQTAGNLVARIVKLAAGVQLGHDHLNGRHAFLGMEVHGNAAAVVPHGNAVVRMQNDGNVRTIARHGLVNGVIHHLINQMVQAPPVRGADIHGRALAHGRQALKNGDGRGVVAAVAGGVRSH